MRLARIGALIFGSAVVGHLLSSGFPITAMIVALAGLPNAIGLYKHTTN